MNIRRRPRVSLDLLRGFHAAARHLSFTRAAHELCVTQPAISREVKALEEQLGRPLFQRVNRALRLTPAGEELYRAADQVFVNLEAAIDRIAEAHKTLAVVTTPAFASLWLAPRLPRFNHEYPGIDVRVAASNDRPNLERDQLDVAIRFVAAGGDFPEGERLFDCTSFPVCAPRLMGDKSRPLRTPADLHRHVRLDYESLRDGRRYSEWDIWLDALKLHRVAPKSTLWFPQYDQLIAAAVEGSGVAVGVMPHVAPHIRQGLLCAPFGDDRTARRGAFFLVRRADAANRDAMNAFASWLRQEVEREHGPPP
jgi:DNA-binding transcriptional LysR family regulator